MCEEKLPTYFISGAGKIISDARIMHYDFHQKNEFITNDYLPSKDPVKILLTSGASCPDAVVEDVIRKLISFFPAALSLESLQLS